MTSTLTSSPTTTCDEVPSIRIGEVSREALSTFAPVAFHPGAAAFDPHLGTIELGRVLPGAPPVRWQLWTREYGAMPGVIYGGPGAGTTTLLCGLLTATAGSDLVTGWVLDRSGVSTALRATGATEIAVGDEHAEEALLRIEAILEDRIAQARNRPQVPGEPLPGAGYRPTPEQPLQLMGITEADQWLRDRNSLLPGGRCATDVLARLVRVGRKFGIALVLVTPDLQAFSSHPVLRAAVLAYNVALLRTGVRPLLPFDGPNPGELPARFPTGAHTAGLGYLRGYPGPFRAYLPL